MELTTVNITAKQMRQEALNSLIRLIESRIEKAARCDAQLFCEFACGKGADLSLIMNIFMEKGFRVEMKERDKNTVWLVFSWSREEGDNE